ncbi:MAG: hypothetical protein JXN10_12265 [Clostridia bacterium]|nr:hypothetical protein [Clostridia bacterium]
MTRIRISLLPAEMRRQSSIMKIWTIVAMVLAILAMILLAANILMSLYLKEPVKELDRLKTEQQNLTVNIGRLSYVKEMFDEIEEIQADIAELRGVDPDWFFVIDSVASDAGLYGVKVDRLEITTAGENPGCVMTCWTADIENIDRWMEHIGENDGVEYVVMTNINTLVKPGNKLEFQFNAVLTIGTWKAE